MSQRIPGIPNPDARIDTIVENAEKIFPGDLIYYYQVVMKHARNLRNEYHNFRHMFYVMWACHQGCLYHRERLLPRDIRNIHIAALFHDFDHSGRTGHDDLEITRALRALRKHLHAEDASDAPAIEEMICATQFPYKTDGVELSLSAQILRDADMSQTFSVSWIQQVVFGLGEEMGQEPRQMLVMQPGFLRSIRFLTPWGQEAFPQSLIDAKIEESQGLLRLLDVQV